MMQRGYVIAFVAVLLAACGGAFVGGRLVWQQVQGGANSPRNWTPPTAVAAVGDWTPAAPAATTTAAAPRETATRWMIPTPAVPTMEPFEYPTVSEEDYVDAIQSPTPEVTVTATVTPTLSSSYAFELARAVRNSSGDCPGSYVIGHVTDAGGNPIPNVRLTLVDEYGNQETTVTKAGSVDAGRYDFPLYGPPRRFYVTVLDGSGLPSSPSVEVANGVGAEAKTTCHWVDWQRQ